MSSASFAYPHHRGEVRAAVATRLRGAVLGEGFLLATCLRHEVTVLGDRERLEETLDALLGPRPAGMDPVVRVDEEAITHLFRVAAGLESPILGETEILTQFRRAVIASEESGAVGGLFAKLLESAVSVGRRARDLLPGSPHNSMAAVAAQVVGGAAEVAVLGSGIIATAVVDALNQLPAPPRVTVVARHPEKIGLGDEVEVWPFTRAGEALARFPAVVSATSAKRRLVDEAAMSQAVSSRSSRLVLVDLAMPPDFDPPPTEVVAYLGIDDLARMAERRPRAAEADALVAGAANEAYLGLLHHHEVAPVLGGLTRHADEVVERTVQRFRGRLGGGDDVAVLRQAAHTVARTLLAGPMSYLKEAPEASDVIAGAFGVADD